MNSAQSKNHLLTKTWAVVFFAFIACFLWGSAFPSVKTGYRLFNIDSSNIPTLLLFAGARFFLAGILVILIGSIVSRRFLRPKASSIGPVSLLAFFQTFLQYVFFYIGIANSSGVKSSIIEAANTFFTILIAVFIFRTEKLSVRKIIGCLVGFAGVVIINLNGSGFDANLSFTGEGFILISTVASAFASSLVKKFSKNDDPVALSGYQFLLGGAGLAIIGFVLGGRITIPSFGAAVLLLYLAIISAVAYSIWSLLLKYNPVSKVSIFGFANPVIGVILSAIILNEQNQAFSFLGLASLLLVSIGIIIVYVNKRKS